MAWSPVRRTNAGCFEVDHPGDYATFNSYHPSDATWADPARDFLIRSAKRKNRRSNCQWMKLQLQITLSQELLPIQ
jgi:hypothetical protein